MPYTPPARIRYDLDLEQMLDKEQMEQAEPPTEDGIPASHPVVGRDPAQEELQVRQTAQRILAAHLQLPPEILSAAAQRRQPSARRAFWPRINLDLTGAALIDFVFDRGSVVKGSFGGATFHGNAWFSGATFHGITSFDRATFHGNARFHGATFNGEVRFDGVTFQGRAFFPEATFQGIAFFREAAFQGEAVFDKLTFQSAAFFSQATFHGNARFDGMIFQDTAFFVEAAFRGSAWFREAAFHGSAFFREATFHGSASFRWATFSGDIKPLAGARVLQVDDSDLNKGRMWPDGWTVHPDPVRPPMARWSVRSRRRNPGRRSLHRTRSAKEDE